MMAAILFFVGFVLGWTISVRVCKAFKSTDKLELTILKLINERLMMDVEHYKNLVKRQNKPSEF